LLLAEASILNGVNGSPLMTKRSNDITLGVAIAAAAFASVAAILYMVTQAEHLVVFVIS
jgi:hypothetical protein